MLSRLLVYQRREILSKIQNGQNFLHIFTKLLSARVQTTVNIKYKICVRKSFTSLSNFDNHPEPHLQCLQHIIDIFRHPQTFFRVHFKQLHGFGNYSGIEELLVIYGIICSFSLRR